jgi:hypothetical protein
MLTLILIGVLITIALGGGGWGYSRYGWAGFSPAGVVVLIVAVLYFSGNLGVPFR